MCDIAGGQLWEVEELGRSGARAPNHGMGLVGKALNQDVDVLRKPQAVVLNFSYLFMYVFTHL